MRSTSLRRGAALAFAAALTLTACGGDDGDTADASSSASETDASESTSEDASASDGATEDEGGEAAECLTGEYVLEGDALQESLGESFAAGFTAGAGGDAEVTVDDVSGQTMLSLDGDGGEEQLKDVTVTATGTVPDGNGGSVDVEVEAVINGTTTFEFTDTGEALQIDSSEADLTTEVTVNGPDGEQTAEQDATTSFEPGAELPYSCTDGGITVEVPVPGGETVESTYTAAS